MVLAAGLGTRLRPLTLRVAKPALPLLGSTLLEANLALAARAGADEVVVNAHHLPHTVAAAARRGAARLGLRLHLSFEAPDVRGTGGALVLARPLLDRGDPFLLVNGDVLADLDVGAAVRAHRASGAATTLLVRPHPGGDFGAVEVDGAGRVARAAVGFGRDLAPGERTTRYLFAGIHVLGPEIFGVLPATGAPCVNRQGHAELIRRGRHVHAHLDAGGSFSDVGTPDRYLAAQFDVLEGRIDRAAIGDPLAGAIERSPGVFVDPTATVAPGAHLEAPCYVGAGVRIGPVARLRRAAVLAGGSVDGEVEDAAVVLAARVAAGERLARVVRGPDGDLPA
jgi:mannose-1-phosphate guanylyltransferase